MKYLSNFFLVFLLFILTTDTQQLLAQVPKIDSVFPENVYVGSLLTIKGSKMNYTASVTINAVSALIVSAADSQLVLMVMPGTVTGSDIVITSFSGGQSIYAGETIVHASKPPTQQLYKKLFDSTVSADPQEGSSVAISADGNTAVVGGQYGNNSVGAVWVYTRKNNAWKQQGDTLVGTGATGKSFQGCSVAVSADGNTLIEGGVGDNGFTGATWIFTRNQNNVWSQQGNKLVGSSSIVVQGTTPEQGYAVSLSGDGNTAIIGGRRDSNYVGAAWVFTRSNNIWTEQQKLIGTGYINIVNNQGFPQHSAVEMGNSVALSADGNTALVGGPNDNNDTGAVWVFVRNGNAWSQQGNKLVGSDGYRSFYGGVQQGTSVAASADGNTLIEGGPFDTDSSTGDITNNYYNGAVWMFTRSGNAWAQQGNKLFAADASLGAEQGWSVSISADGNTAIVGAPTDSGYVGGSWVYTRSNNIWSQASNKLLGTGYLGSPKQGWSVNISADGNTAIVGGPENNPLGTSWVFADTGNIILPVTLSNFKAYLLGKGIQTTWNGYNEINMSSYEVERSVNGHNFNKLANIIAKSNNFLQNNYTWFDATPFAGNNFYRLKAISKDGRAQYSLIVKVNISDEQSSIQVYPNPVYNKQINLQLNNIAAGNYNITVYNTSGETFYSQSFQHRGGSRSVPINLKNAAAGVYYVELKNSTYNFHLALILK